MAANRRKSNCRQQQSELAQRPVARRSPHAHDNSWPARQPKRAKRASKCRVLAATSEPHPFTWRLIEEAPKVMRSCLKRAHRTMEYEILHTGGFVRLCTERGRVYWLAQNMHDHCVPDWKIHFSVHPEDVPMAWDLLTQLFMDNACDFGMKAVSADALGQWPEKQRGREITVYIFRDCAEYVSGGPMMDICKSGTEHRFYLGPEFEREGPFWESFVQQATSLLRAYGIRSNGGIADGDLPLGGPYASLRNEAFVPCPIQSASERCPVNIYPPNAAGWNAAGHQPPMRLPSMCWRLLCYLSAAACPRRVLLA